MKTNDDVVAQLLGDKRSKHSYNGGRRSTRPSTKQGHDPLMLL